MNRAQAAMNGSLRQLADELPPERGFLVVLADPPGLPRVEQRLRILEIPSAWQRLPGLTIGLISPSPGGLDRVVEMVRRNAMGRVGVSPLTGDAAQVDVAFRLARTALAASTAADPVIVFDESPLAMTVVADSEVAQRVVQVVLGGLDDLPPDDREILLDTLGTWSTHNGSASETAIHLYCHPNTVRYRLRRLEERTGRSLTDPRAVAELLLALEALQSVAKGSA
ncbi:helix-turn-helix domain-containing protein [Streptomyces sp. SID13031]|uniref:helix-turn-helix domain-containing protein n=1 Tax=Streptomyces sp. SID13031 TaxID=2706046 RepID=UPI0013C99AFF|nr:helix-turn-helix domain-containing protein [Streptomyces sp. SID13031]NEA30588.1 PucR family transcriptional regulator [Streptomyces sp. SID13031]